MKCDRCNFDDATKKADRIITKHFPQYENLCDYDFMILHKYVGLMEKVKQK